MIDETKIALLKIVAYIGANGQRESWFRTPDPEAYVEMYGLLDTIRDLGVSPEEIDAELVRSHRKKQ